MTPLQQALAARRRVTGSRRPRAVPRVAPPTGIVVAYTRILLDASDAMDAMILDTMHTSGHLRHDDSLPMELLRRLEKALQRVWGRQGLIGVLDHIATSVVDRAGREFRAQVQRALGVHLLSDPDLSRFVNTFRAENIKLIKSLAEDKMDRVRQILTEKGNTRVEVTAKAIQAATGATRARAALIARDQVLSLNSKVTQARHEAAGITEYVWSTSRDERVRASHEHLQGSKQRYSSPPVVDQKTGRRAHPGQDYQCRCVAIPILPE